MAIANFVPSAKPIVLGNSSANKSLILIHGLTLSGRQFMPIGEFLLANLGGRLANHFAHRTHTTGNLDGRTNNNGLV